MTKYHSRAEINQNTAKMDADDKRAAAGRAVTDPSAARDFTATSLWVPETQAMPVATASDLGVLALSLVRHLLEPIKAKALREPEAAKDELTVLFAALPVPDARDLTQTVKDLKNLTPGFRQMLQTKSGRKTMKLNAHYFGASVTAFQSGYDGHWITREAALRLRLVRYYEKTSGEFASSVHRAMAALSRNGTAYAAWSAGWPVFVCDLNRTFERYAAQELLAASQGRLAVVTPPLTPETQVLVARYAPEMAVVIDEAGLLSVLLGNYSTVMLLERRIGGWTVTFPAGGASEKDLRNRKYPAFARALARCAVLPASFAAENGSDRKQKHTSVKEAA